MKKFIFFSATLFFFSCSLFSSAQEGQQVKVFLKNGVKIKGAVVHTFDENKLVVNVMGSDKLLIQYNHIKKVRFKKYGVLRDDFDTSLQNPPKLKVNSYFHELRGSLLFGEETQGVALNTINGYQFNKFLGAGLGIGINKYGNYLAMPIYAQVKGYVFEKKVSPFYFGDIGYGYAWNTNKNQDVFELDNVKGGLYWQIGLGYQINFYNNSMVFSLGYINQVSKADYVYYRPWSIDDVEVSEKRILRRFAFSVGFLF